MLIPVTSQKQNIYEVTNVGFIMPKLCEYYGDKSSIIKGFCCQLALLSAGLKRLSLRRKHCKSPDETVPIQLNILGCGKKLKSKQPLH